MMVGEEYIWEIDKEGRRIRYAPSSTPSPVENWEYLPILDVAVQVKRNAIAGHTESIEAVNNSLPFEIPNYESNIAITGTGSIGETLTTTVTDKNGVPSEINYQWYADGEVISGATVETYVIKESDSGKTITVQADFTDKDGFSESATDTVGVAVDDNPENQIANITISGVAKVGETLTAEVTDSNGLPSEINYQWYADGEVISGATADTYIVKESDSGKTLTVQADFTDIDSYTESVTATVDVEYVDPELGLRADYSGTGWYKATDTGTVFSKDIPDGETHVFSDSPVEYVSIDSVWDAQDYGAARAATSNITDMSWVFSGDEEFNEDISSWDVSNVTSMEGLFEGATAFNQDISNWDVSNVTNMSYMLSNSAAFTQDISNWDVSSVTDMTYMFNESNVFNLDISNWNVSSVTNMEGMFYDASSFNQDISNWDVSNVTNMNIMFYNATSFNSDISNWNVSNVTDTADMFNGASSFNQDISSWNVSSVTSIGGMFMNATSFNQDISNWDVSNVTGMRNMFNGASLFNSDISNWNVSSVTNMLGTFNGATSFNQDISNWNVGSVTLMTDMFNGASSFNQDLSGWCVSKIASKPTTFDDGAVAWTLPKPVWGTCPPPEMGLRADYSGSGWYKATDTGTVFNKGVPALETHVFKDSPTEYISIHSVWDTLDYGARAAVSNITSMDYLLSGDDTFNEDISGWDVSNVTNMEYMFDGAASFNQDISNWDVSNVTNMEGMFKEAAIFTQDLSNWDVSSVTNMSDMFKAKPEINQNISNWNVSSVTNMKGMFEDVTSLTSDISNWNVSSVTDMNRMFFYSAFNPDISNWDVSSVTNMENMFYGAAFNPDISNWDVSSVTNMNSMFSDTPSFNSNISNWNVSSVTDMGGMFLNVEAFNQDLSGWCVANIPSLPSSFDSNAVAWTLPKPVWGTCPRGEDSL